MSTQPLLMVGVGKTPTSYFQRAGYIGRSVDTLPADYLLSPLVLSLAACLTFLLPHCPLLSLLHIPRG